MKTHLVRIYLLMVLFLMHFMTNQAQNINKYSSIPRIDAHAHFGVDFNDLDRVMELRRQVSEQTGIDIALWIDLGRGHRAESLDPNQPDNIEEVLSRYKNRILPCINDYIIRDGLAVVPEDLVKWQSRGIAGYKIHCGSQSRVLEILPKENKIQWWEIDHPANDATFTKMEQLGMVAAGMHIGTPYLPEGAVNWQYGNNAYEYWSAINAFENVLERHPGLIVVGAHMLFLCSSEEQLDYLDYMLVKYPNLYLDVTYAYPFLSRAGDEFTRRFFIKNSERILLGTDIDRKRLSGSYWDKTVKDDNYIPTYGHFYREYFNFFEEKLALPPEVLERIYYKNAIKIYPHVKESLLKLGYKVD